MTVGEGFTENPFNFPWSGRRQQENHHNDFHFCITKYPMVSSASKPLLHSNSSFLTDTRIWSIDCFSNRCLWLCILSIFENNYPSTLPQFVEAFNRKMVNVLNISVKNFLAEYWKNKRWDFQWSQMIGLMKDSTNFETFTTEAWDSFFATIWNFLGNRKAENDID